MDKLITITLDSFLLLRRDRVFIPAIIGGLAIAIIANLASWWSIEGFNKILFDIGTFGYHMIGSVVAILWGTKIVSDAKLEGAIEAQLAAPISRTTWLLGKFLGLGLCLFFLSIILLVLWQIIMIINDFGIMSMKHLMIFLFFNFSWFVLAAISIFFSTFTTQATALFSSLSVWIVGLSSGLVKATMSPETDPMSRGVVNFFSVFWNLQKFNFSDRATSAIQITSTELFWSASYGVALIIFIMAFASVIFHKRDLIS